jgi:nitrogen fixation protein NifQ
MAIHAVMDRPEHRPMTYRMLTGCSIGDAAIAVDRDFDRHVFACLLAIAATEEGSPGERLGLGGDDLAALIERWFPHARGAWSARREADAGPDDDEIAMVRELLIAHRSNPGNDSRWLAAMIARRALEPNHLWEDLGLRDRSELSRLLARHFTPLARRNTNNMRWKRFFYRTLCEADGLVMCLAPVCTSCGDFNACFGDESGVGRLAERRRQSALLALT